MEILCYQFSQLQSKLASSYQILDTEEQEQAKTRGEKYILARAQLKRELARRTHTKPELIHLSYNNQGKPYWEAQASEHFNISHSRDMLCIALDSRGPLGIDVEYKRQRSISTMQRIALKFMTAEQQATWACSEQPLDDFYIYWCQYEAQIKRHGLSIWQSQELTEAEKHTPSALEHFSPHPDYQAAISYKRLIE